MVITTKFSKGDNVWYMEDNSPKEGIVLGVTIGYDDFHYYSLQSPSVTYYLESQNGSEYPSSGMCSMKCIGLNERYCFKTKSDLLSSL